MITLQDLIKIPRFSDLKLVTNTKSLDQRTISSVEITETPDVGKFIPKNVLILTTAMVFENNQKELIPFIDSLIESEAIGIAIKVNRFLKQIDEEVIEYANRVNFPLLIIPDYYPLGSLLHQIMSVVLESEREEMSFALDIQRSFSNLLVQGASNDLLVSEFSLMIKSPIILLNPFKQIISRSQHFKNHLEQAEFYVQECFSSSPTTNRKHSSVIVKEADGSTTHLQLVEINVYSYYPHYLIIVNPEKIPYPASVFAIEQAAMVFQFNLYKNLMIDESLFANEAHFFTDLLNNQARGTFVESNWLTLSRKYGYIQSDFHQAILVNSKDMAQASSHSTTLKMNEKAILSYHWLRKHLDQYFNHALVFWRAENEEIILILQEEPTDLSSKLEAIAEDVHSLLDNQLLFSVGHSFLKWDKIEQSYIQTKLAYNQQIKDKNFDTVVYYRDSGVEQLFNQLDNNEIIYFCKSVLKDLAYPTEESKLDLRETLDTYLKNQGEISKTSNDLFIHRNTVKYRINRCEEILDVKIDDPEVSLNIRLALELSKKN